MNSIAGKYVLNERAQSRPEDFQRQRGDKIPPGPYASDVAEKPQTPFSELDAMVAALTIEVCALEGVASDLVGHVNADKAQNSPLIQSGLVYGLQTSSAKLGDLAERVRGVTHALRRVV